MLLWAAMKAIKKLCTNLRVLQSVQNKKTQNYMKNYMFLQKYISFRNPP